MSKIYQPEELFDKLANRYQDLYMDTSLYHESFDLFCDSIQQKNAEILELACGPGNITQYLLRKRPDLKILATDLAPKMLELAAINNPAANFQLMDCRDIEKLNKKFDGIMCGFCLPYLSKEDAIKLIRNASQALKPEGVLYISTMEDNYSKSGLEVSSSGEQVYMYYHEAGYITEALGENGFKTINLSRKKSTWASGKTVVDMLIVARK